MEAKNQDLVAENCRTLLFTIITQAVKEAKDGSPASARFFADPDSPFWDMADHLGLDADLIVTEILNRKKTTEGERCAI